MKIADDFYEKNKDRLHRRVARELRSARRIVDIGCGNCDLAGVLAEVQGREVIGVDVLDDVFPALSAKGRRPRCIKANARALDFLTDATVDAVVSVWALHELTAPMAVLRETMRILRPGGTILIVDFPRRSLAQRLWNENYYTTGEVREMLRQVGFVRVEARRIARRQLTWARGDKPPVRNGRP